jgi:hypothetical protein
VSADGSDPFSLYFGSPDWQCTPDSLNASFTGILGQAGRYLIGVGATDTLKDKAGNTLGTVLGTGFVGYGTVADISPPDGTYDQPVANY